MRNHNPIFNLKAVLQETGLSADTLRAWERRYGIPSPERSAGGHRLYSEYEIEMIKWLMARQNEGMSISRAVEMWRELTAEGRDPLESVQPTRGITPLTAPAALPQAIYLPPETGLEGLRAQWVAACLNYNESGAEQVLNQAFSMYPIEFICAELLARGLNEIGMLWYENRASVQQEHFASGLVLRRINALISAAPSPTRSFTVVVGCPSQELHTFTSLLITLFLRRRGLNVIYLGADVPDARMEETLAAIQPHLIVLSSQQLFTAASLQNSAITLAARGAKVAFGGRIFSLLPGLRQRIPGFYLGETLETAVETIEALLVERRNPTLIALPPAGYETALRSFARQRPLLENFVNQRLLPPGGQGEYFAIAHRFLGNNISAALQLGDINFLDGEIEWLRSLLDANHLPAQVVKDYLAAYASASQEILGEDGAPLTAWLQKHSQ